MPDDGEQGYSVGSAWLQIVPSFRDVAEKIDTQARQWGARAGGVFSREFNSRVLRDTRITEVGPGDAQAAQRGSKSGGAFAEGFRRRVEAALRALPSPKVGVDATEADAELADLRARLEALRDVRVGVDIDDREALAQLSALRARLDELGAQSPSVQVQADTARANAELAAVQAEVNRLDGQTATVNVRADTSGASGIAGVGSLLAAALPAAVPLLGAGVAGGAGLVSAGAAGVGSLGVAGLAFSGINKALEAQSAAHAQAGAAAQRDATAQTSAAAQIKSAEEGLAQARATAATAAVQAAEQVKNAERSLADTERQVAQQQRQDTERVATAKRSEVQASRSLQLAQDAENAAREQAVRDLQDYANAAADAHLSAQQAQLNLTAAQANLATTSPADTTAYAQAQLSVAQAQQAVVEANEQAQRATDDNTKAQAAGVKGDAGVVAAAKQVSDARQRQRDATRALRDAQRQQAQDQVTGAEQIAKAEQGVADAQRAQATQQRQSAYAIQQAMNTVAAAQRSQTAAATQTTTANSKAAAALAKLSPAGADFVRFVHGSLEPVFEHMQHTAQAGLLPGVTAGLRAMLPLAKPLDSFIGGLARTMGHLATQAGKALTDPFWTRFFRWVSKTASPTLTTMVHILEHVGKGFAGLLMAMSPVTNAIGRTLDHAAAAFARFGAHASDKNSPFQSFLRFLEQTGPQIVNVLQNAGPALLKVAQGFAPLGSLDLKAASGLLSIIGNLPVPVITALAVGFQAIAIGTRAIAIGTVAWAVAQAILDTALSPFLPLILGLGLTILAVVAAVAALGIGVYELVKHWRGAWTGIQDAAHFAWHKVLKPVFDAIGAAIDFVKQHWRTFATVFAALVGGPILGAVVLIVTHFKTFKAVAADAIHAVGAAAQWLWTKAIHPAWSAIAKFARTLWGDVEKSFVTGVNTVIRIIDDFLTVIDKVLGYVGIHVKWHISPISAPTAQHAVSFSTGQGDRVGVPHASGGTLAGGSIGPGFVTRGPRAIVGEGNPNHPEYVIPTDPTHRGRALALYESLGTHLLAGGGILGWGKHLLGDATGFLRGLAAKGAGAALSAAESPAMALLHHLPDGLFKSLLTGLIDKLNSGVKHLISGSGGGSGASVGGGVARWTPQVRAALALLHQPGSLAAGVLRRIGFESGGNPTAVNRTDSNWLAGTPSVGLMQVIGPTFKDNAGRFLHTGPFLYGVSTDPLANIFAGLRHAIAAEGSIAAIDPNVRPYGYDSGGVLSPGLTMAFNGTGKPEAVFTGDQLSDLATASRANRESTALLKQLIAATREVAPGVTDGVAGEFRSAAREHAGRVEALHRKAR